MSVFVEMAEKLSFQAVEKRAKPFIESVIPLNVERLQKHRENLQTVSRATRRSVATYGVWYTLCSVVGASSTVVRPLFAYTVLPLCVKVVLTLLHALVCQFHRDQNWEALHKEHVLAHGTLQVRAPHSVTLCVCAT